MLRGNSILIYGLQQHAGKILGGKELVLLVSLIRFPDSAQSCCWLEPVLAEEKISVKVK